MKKNTILLSIVLFCSLLYFASCQNKENISDTIASSNPTEVSNFVELFNDDELAIINEYLNLPKGIDFTYNLKIPEHAGGNTFSVDNVQATLGRVLFYDKELSIDNKISCASCHKQELAFADDVALSKGVNNNLTERNSLSIGSFPSFQQYYNLGANSFSTLNTKLFWDDRVTNPIDQMSETFENPKEMGMDMATLVERVSEKEYYKIFFNKAFASGEISDLNIKIALRTFMSSLHSSNTRFDRVYNDMGSNTHIKTDFLNFTTSENTGKKLFADLCMNCHGSSLSGNLANSFSTANNGLDQEFTDLGVGGFTLEDADVGKFKIPALRNIELTGPYMHDGRFETLEEVVDFYNDGVNNHPNLHSNLKLPNGEVKKLNLSVTDKVALVDFLKTLTDPVLTSHEKYSNPFKN